MAVLWQDKRSVNEAKKIKERIGAADIYSRTGLKIDPYFSLPKIMWFRKVFTIGFNASSAN